MQPHTKVYLDHFGLGEQDQIFDEVDFLEHGKLTIAVDIHHVNGRSKDGNAIQNLIALSRYNHNLAHESKHTKRYLSQLHERFLRDNPY